MCQQCWAERNRSVVLISVRKLTKAPIWHSRTLMLNLRKYPWRETVPIELTIFSNNTIDFGPSDQDSLLFNPELIWTRTKTAQCILVWSLYSQKLSSWMLCRNIKNPTWSPFTGGKLYKSWNWSVFALF